jgi:hypothetical protein
MMMMIIDRLFVFWVRDSDGRNVTANPNEASCHARRMLVNNG